MRVYVDHQVLCKFVRDVITCNKKRIGKSFRGVHINYRLPVSPYRTICQLRNISQKVEGDRAVEKVVPY